MYKKSTGIFNIPYICQGDTLEESSERIKYQIIENQLFAGIMGVSKVIFEDGDYDLFDNNNGTYLLTIAPEYGYSLLGICNYRLMMEKDTIVIDGLQKGNFYYIYAVYQTEMNVEPKRFRRIATDSLRNDNYHVLLATVNLRGDTPVINDYPDGKEYSKNILAHITDKSNPHGRDLAQDRLIIYDSLKINDNPVYETIYLEGSFTGNGYATMCSAPKKVVFAQLMPKEPGYGQYWIQLSENNVYVYNDGNSGGSFILEVRLIGE